MLVTEPEESHGYWLTLINEAMAGDPFDMNDPDDLIVFTEQLEIAANIDQSPAAQLTRALSDILEENPAEDALSLSQFEAFEQRTFAVRDIAEITLHYPGEPGQPNRHSEIRAILRDYEIHEAEVLDRIFAVTDAYRDDETVL